MVFKGLKAKLKAKQEANRATRARASTHKSQAYAIEMDRLEKWRETEEKGRAEAKGRGSARKDFARSHRTKTERAKSLLSRLAKGSHKGRR